MRYLPLLPVVFQIPLFPSLECPYISGIPLPFFIFSQVTDKNHMEFGMKR